MRNVRSVSLRCHSDRVAYDDTMWWSRFAVVSALLVVGLGACSSGEESSLQLEITEDLIALNDAGSFFDKWGIEVDEEIASCASPKIIDSFGIDRLEATGLSEDVSDEFSKALGESVFACLDDSTLRALFDGAGQATQTGNDWDCIWDELSRDDVTGALLSDVGGDVAGYEAAVETCATA